MSEPLQDGTLTDLETALRGLRPAAGLQRDQLMFRAGQLSASRRVWLWPVSAAAMTAVAASLVTVLVIRPQPQEVERVVFAPVQMQTPATIVREEPPPPLPRVFDHYVDTPPLWAQQHGNELWYVERQALRWGIESLPLPPLPESTGRPPQTLGSFMNDLAKGELSKLP
jgi:hypothetical protein